MTAAANITPRQARQAQRAADAIGDAIRNAWSYRHFTSLCREHLHGTCNGYIAPLVYSDTRPCDCECHATSNPASFHRALIAARGF